MRFAEMSSAGLCLTIGLALAAFLWPGLSLAGTPNHSNQDKTMLPTQHNSLSPGVKIPPLDTAVPATIETATFSLG